MQYRELQALLEAMLRRCAEFPQTVSDRKLLVSALLPEFPGVPLYPSPLHTLSAVSFRQSWKDASKLIKGG